MTEKIGDRWKQYFVAIIPPSPWQEEALALKHYFSERYNSGGALRSPPDITLHMPFRWKEENEDLLIASLTAFAVQHKSFVLAFENFGSFPPRVIFIALRPSEELAMMQTDLQRHVKAELNLFNANYKEHPFRPHLTVAFRDLRKSAFREAWDEFKEKHGEFAVERIVLLKHNGIMWEVFKEFSLPGHQRVT